MKSRLLIIIGLVFLGGIVGLAYAYHDGTVHPTPNAEMTKEEFTVAVMTWDKSSYFASGAGIVRVTDSDMNLNSDRLDALNVQVWSDSDAGGIDFVLIETGDSTGMFEGTVSFTPSDESSGSRLRVLHGDVITAKYVDDTLPLQYTTYHLDITIKSKIKDVPLSPLKQQLSGISPDEIICKDRFEKVFKHDGSVACANPLTVEKLIYRGWASDEILNSNIVKFSPVLFKGTGVDLESEELIILLKEKQEELDIAFDEFGIKGLYPIVGGSFSIGHNAYSVDEKYAGKPIALDIRVLEDEFTKTNLKKIDQLIRKYIGNEIDIVYSKGSYAVPTPRG